MKKTILSALISAAIVLPAFAQAPASQEDAAKAFEAQHQSQIELQQKMQELNAAYVIDSKAAAEKMNGLKDADARTTFVKERNAADAAHMKAMQDLMPKPDVKAIESIDKDLQAKFEADVKKMEADRQEWLANMKKQQEARQAKQDTQHKAAQAAADKVHADAKAKMDADMKASKEFNDKMQAAKTNEERQALSKSHMEAQKAKVEAAMPKAPVAPVAPKAPVAPTAPVGPAAPAK
jgi:hypothetical protein